MGRTARCLVAVLAGLAVFSPGAVRVTAQPVHIFTGDYRYEVLWFQIAPDTDVFLQMRLELDETGAARVSTGEVRTSDGMSTGLLEAEEAGTGLQGAGADTRFEFDASDFLLAWQGRWAIVDDTARVRSRNPQRDPRTVTLHFDPATGQTTALRHELERIGGGVEPTDLTAVVRLRREAGNAPRIPPAPGDAGPRLLARTR